MCIKRGAKKRISRCCIMVRERAFLRARATVKDLCHCCFFITYPTCFCTLFYSLCVGMYFSGLFSVSGPYYVLFRVRHTKFTR